jgi:hypothetical protein
VLYGPGITHAAYFDLDGDGAIETVIIKFASNLTYLPSQLEFTIKDDVDGIAVTRLARLDNDEIEFFVNQNDIPVKSQVVVTLDDPFPIGMTTVTPYPDSYGHSFREDSVPISERDFPVADSVPPVIVKAEISDPDITDQPQTITVTFSEAVNINPDAVEPLLVKRDSVLLNDEGLEIVSITQVEGRPDQYIFELAQGTYAVGGDSVAININGEVTDALGRAPEVINYTRGEGKSPAQELKSFHISRPKDQLRGASISDLSRNTDSFILIGASGEAIIEGECSGCYVQEEGKFVGPVFSFIVEFPVKYEFIIYDNLGRYITTGKGQVLEGDLPFLEDVTQDGDIRPRYKVRIVWDGRDETGTKVGSGVFVIKATFSFPENLDLGSQASTIDFLKKFGHIK